LLDCTWWLAVAAHVIEEIKQSFFTILLIGVAIFEQTTYASGWRTNGNAKLSIAMPLSVTHLHSFGQSVNSLSISVLLLLGFRKQTLDLLMVSISAISDRNLGRFSFSL